MRRHSIPLTDLVVHRSALDKAVEHCVWGDCGRSTGPLEVISVPGESRKYQLVDGYHRLVKALLQGAHSIEAEVVPNNGTWLIARPRQRFRFDPKMPYKGLERLMAADELTDLIRALGSAR